MTDQTVPQAQPAANPHAKPPTKPGPNPGEFTAEMSLVRTVKHLWPYVWPADRFDLKLRACLALSMMLFAKLVTLSVPFSFKWVTDALVEEGAGAVTASVLAGAIALTILYGFLRAFMQLFTPSFAD